MVTFILGNSEIDEKVESVSEETRNILERK